MGGGLAIGFGPLEGFVDSLLQKFENCRFILEPPEGTGAGR
jgi:hypothetical protein